MMRMGTCGRGITGCMRASVGSRRLRLASVWGRRWLLRGACGGGAQLTPVRTISEIREDYSKTPGCTMEYGEGVYPLPRLDLGGGGGVAGG